MAVLFSSNFIYLQGLGDRYSGFLIFLSAVGILLSSSELIIASLTSSVF